MQKKSLVILCRVKTLGSRNSRQAADAIRHQRGIWSSNPKWPRMFLLCFRCVDPSPNDTRTHTPVLSLWPESFCFPVLNPERLDPQISDRIVGIIERIESSMWPPYCRVLQLWRCRACRLHPATRRSQISVVKNSSETWNRQGNISCFSPGKADVERFDLLALIRNRLTALLSAEMGRRRLCSPSVHQ